MKKYLKTYRECPECKQNSVVISLIFPNKDYFTCSNCNSHFKIVRDSALQLLVGDLFIAHILAIVAIIAGLGTGSWIVFFLTLFIPAYLYSFLVAKVDRLELTGIRGELLKKGKDISRFIDKKRQETND